jgi:hypothetical protein
LSKEKTAEQTLAEKHGACPYYETKCDDLPCFCPKYQAYLDVQDPEIVNETIKSMNVTATDTFGIMLGIQKHFASRFHDVDEPSSEVTDYWVKEYCICIEDEFDELMDYIKLPLTDAKMNNTEEMKKEVIDILHFVMDDMVAGGISMADLYKHYNSKYETFYNNDDDLFVNEFNKYKADMSSAVTRAGSLQNVYLDYAVNMLLVNRDLRQQVSWKHWKNKNDSINYDKLFDAYAKQLNAFIKLAASMFDSAENVKTVYVNKNVENIRRQNYGY